MGKRQEFLLAANLWPGKCRTACPRMLFAGNTKNDSEMKCDSATGKPEAKLMLRKYHFLGKGIEDVWIL
jgi:hypothetical protein